MTCDVIGCGMWTNVFGLSPPTLIALQAAETGVGGSYCGTHPTPVLRAVVQEGKPRPPGILTLDLRPWSLISCFSVHSGLRAKLCV